jgi:hypothetical protein
VKYKGASGLGVEVFGLKSMILLSNWLYKFINKEGMWHELLHNEYLQSKNISLVSEEPTDSPFWKGLINVKEDFFARESFVAGNGLNSMF